LEGNKDEGCKTVEAKVTKRDGPRSQPVVILEKESSTGASTCKLMFLEVLESKVVGNLNLQVTSKGPVCQLFRVF
jgi:hypothetical protein